MSEYNRVRWVGVRPTPAASLSSGQVSVTSVDTAVLAANANRDYALVKNISAVDVYVKPAASITTANGELLHEGDFAIYEGYTGAVRAITASGTAKVYYEEG